MSSGGKMAGIQCPSGLFPTQEAEVARLTEVINRAPTAAEKAPWARALLEAVGPLLACEHHDQESSDCRLCRQFSELRHRTTALLVRVGHLGR